MAAGGTPGNVKLGAGKLYVAPLGTTEPTNASAALPSSWVAVGYTEAGTTFTTGLTSTGIDVAEEVDPIQFIVTARTNQLALTMVEATKKRLTLAMGSGAAGTDDASTFEPPDPSAIVGVMFVWDKLDTPDATNARWLFRQCTPGGTVAMAHQKAPAKFGMPVTFDCAKTTAGLAPYKVFPSSTGIIA